MYKTGFELQKMLLCIFLLLLKLNFRILAEDSACLTDIFILSMKKITTGLLLLTFLGIVACQNPTKNKEKTQADTLKPLALADTATRRDTATAPKPEADKPLPQIDGKLNDLARLIAGLPVDSSSAYAYLCRTASWKRFSRNMDSSFAKIDRERFARMRTWRKTELAAYNDSRTLFYPFSGPDFVHAYNFFNQSKTMYMFGLEQVGSMPVFTKKSEKDMANYCVSVQNYLSDVMNKSFFITKKMNANWYQVNGMTPILAIFMARTGNQLVKITPMRLDSTGKPNAVLPTARFYNMVKIDYADADTKALKSVYYYSGDLSDGAIKKGSPVEKYLTAYIPQGSNGFLKSASYLLHYAYFSKMNAILKDRCQAILQDDTGVPYKAFEKNKWNFTLYGIYATPIFTNSEQADLKKAYKDSSNTIRPLPFGIGYHWMNRKDNLMLAVKKSVQ